MDRPPESAASAAFVAPAAERLPARWGRAALGLLLLGATLGSALDGIHTRLGATEYARPLFLRMTWWTPLLFAGAFAIGLLRPLIDTYTGARTGRSAPRPSGLAVLTAMALFVLAYFVSVLPLGWPAVSGLLLAIFAVGYALFDRSRVGLLIALGAAIGGPLVEMLLISCGTFVHLRPAYLLVSGWLPFLYLCAAVALTTLARWLV